MKTEEVDSLIKWWADDAGYKALECQTLAHHFAVRIQKLEEELSDVQPILGKEQQDEIRRLTDELGKVKSTARFLLKRHDELQVAANALGVALHENEHRACAKAVDRLHVRIKELEVGIAPRPMDDAPKDVEIYALVRVRVTARGTDVVDSGYQGWLPLNEPSDQRGGGGS